MSRPNILLLFTDQQRWDTIHAGGNPVIKTPNLDRLTREGVSFDSAYTPSPVCVPARCSLIHGQYPHHTGCAENADDMPVDRPNFMQALTDAGYRTHGIGKMHFRPDPQALRGFQTREHQEELRADVNDDDYLQYLHRNGFRHAYDPMGVRGEMYYVPQVAQMPSEHHATSWVGTRSVEFLRTHAPEQPFFLWSSFIDPHPPFAPPTPWHKLYRGPLMPLPKRPTQPESLQTYMNRFQNRYKYRDNGIDNNLVRMIKAYYYATISFIDYQVGRILEALEEIDQLDNTLILYTSDHGELLGDYDCFGKRSMLDSAARVPLLVRYPERFAQGDVCRTPTSLVDVMPTFLGTAGAPTRDLQMDGVDLCEIAGGLHADGRTVYSQFAHRDRGLYMAVNESLKYSYSSADRQEYLIDRTEDPDETRNRAGLVFCQDQVARMRADLHGYYRTCGYTEPMDDESWKLFPQPTVPSDPDAGLMIQDHPWAKQYERIPGYTD